MDDKAAQKPSNEKNQMKIPDNKPSLEGSNFEKLIEDTLEDNDLSEEMDEELNPEIPANGDEQKTENTADITRTTHEIMEIIAQNELIEQAKREKIKSIIGKQKKAFQKKTENLDLLNDDLEIINRKRKLAKKAFKKAKELKLGNDKIALIRLELKQIKESRRNCRNLIEQEQSELKNIEIIINLLETTI